jgi:hypothetical protein
MRSATLAMAVVVLAALVAASASAAQPKPLAVKVRVDNQAPGYEGWKALDGNRATMWHTRWSDGETPHPHEMLLDLGSPQRITGIAYLPRVGGGNGTIKDYEVYVGDDPKALGAPAAKGEFTRPDAENVVTFAAPATGRYLKLVALSEVAGHPWTSIAGLRLLGPEAALKVASTTEGDGPAFDWATATETQRQFFTLQQDIKARGHFAKVAPETFRPESLIHDADRDPLDVVLRRTVALLADIRRMPGAPDLSAAAADLAALVAEADATAPSARDARLALFEKACAVRRRVALANPLLDFGEILFIKRHRSTFNHMCDQYYGINAVPGGGVYVLADAFGPQPRVRDVLAGAVVERGRLKGRRLEGGSFVSPDLSYDGRTVAFAYVECTGDADHRFHTDPERGHWNEGRSYHVFTAGIDGSGLAQLTDGAWNDFDPCWLPNGRLAMISERRGGYLRCGRVCPTYTLYDMAADGSDVRCLSVHETNEWHPSVTHDGRILYTRWDYVDRHGCTAHLPWITTLDGRDSRAVHGNFAPRPERPDMELDCRAIPGSHKFVATAAPHHGQAYGSLVLVDPMIEDDDRMAPVKRLTPEVGFPESQGGAQVYGTPWPLSENYYLCVYDAGMRPGAGQQGQAHERGQYGIYLVDAFGNKELLYRDAEIACLSPIPLRARPQPAVMPALLAEAPAAQPPAARAQAPAESPPAERAQSASTSAPGVGEPGEGTVVVVNVYDSLKPWPDGTKIAALRVLQVLPMTVPSGSPPHETGIRLPSAGDSVNPVRYVLGTVPVEADGSAHFTVPAQKEIFFQALDERGLAVQSMRSATYLQKGERLACQGCHERRSRQVSLPAQTPLAAQRAPSALVPDVDGSNPFSYPRLVQPVLDRHCVDCHTKNADKAPNLAREPVAKKWYASYNSLAPKYGFHNYGDGYRTTPGRFGALASKLYEHLSKGHHDLKLPPEDLHRLTLWLDCSSLFYGVYEKEGGEAQLRGEVARPTLE